MYMPTKTISAANSSATHPEKITFSEWKEIISCTEVREAWGLENECTPEEFEQMVYGVKFHYVSGSPGYVGDLFILQGDSLERPMGLIRQNGLLVQVM